MSEDMNEKHGRELANSAVALVVVGLVVALVYAFTAAQFETPVSGGTQAQVAERLAPVGTVNVASPKEAAPAAGAESKPAGGQASAAAGEGAGKALFEKTCSACHATGVAGAPKIGDKAAWEPRVAQGTDVLMHSAINGKNAMPPRGTCTDCTDAQLKAAIEYMVSKVK